jgi:MFS family permease
VTYPRVSAVAIGFFLGIVVPFAALMVLGSLMAPREGEEASKWFTWLNTLAVVVALGAPVLGGYLAARISNVQPLLHGCIVGLLGSVLIAFTSSPGIAGLWSLIVFIPGGIVGGWLRKIERDKSAS